MRWWHIIILVFLISAGIAAFALIRRASFSSDDVHITLEGLEAIASGQEVSIRASLENSTSVMLTNVQVTLDFPASLETVEGKRFAILRWDEVGAQGRVSGAVTAIGQGTGESGVIRARVEYSPEGLRGRFVTSKEFSVLPEALPVTSVFDIPSSAVPGQEIDGSLHIVPQENLAFPVLFIELHTPEDFILRETSPALDNNNRWRLEEIEKGREYVFRFRGIVRGDVGEGKIFSVALQREQAGRFVALAEPQATLRLGNAPLDITQNISTSYEGIALPGENIVTTIAYENKSTVAISDARIELTLDGSPFDFSSMSSGSALWDARTHILTWNRSVLPALDELAPGAKGSVTFSISLKKNPEPQNTRDINQTIRFRARISSPQRSLAFGGASLEDEDIQTLRVASAFSLNTQVYFRAPQEYSSWTNGGSIPPQAGAQTTYTVVWTVRNGTNQVRGTRVEGVLPPYVTWTGLYDPTDGSLSYNESVHTLTWELGDLPPGVGNISSARHISFQIQLTPQNEHKGLIIPLIEEATLSGIDSFTNISLDFNTQSIDTSLPDDATISSIQGTVQ
jgi:hypothetical protein